MTFFIYQVLLIKAKTLYRKNPTRKPFIKYSIGVIEIEMFVYSMVVIQNAKQGPLPDRVCDHMLQCFWRRIA